MGVVAGSVLMLVVLGGCGTSLSDSLVGTWTTDLNVIHVEFRDDGTYQATLRRGGTKMVESGSWSVEGSVLTLTPTSASPYCAGTVARYEVQVIDDGNRLDTTVQDDPCQVRLDDLGSGLTRFEDVAPTPTPG